MSKRTQAKSTTEQKVQWKANQNLGSRFTYCGTTANSFQFPDRKYDAQGRRVA